MGGWEGAVEHPVPTCCSLDKGPEMLHATAPTDAPLQQPLVSILPVQELCCGWSAQMTSGVACKIPRKLSSSHQHPPASLKEAAGGRPANHPELGVSDRLWDAHMVFARITRSCQGQPVQLLCLSSLQMSIFSCPSLRLALNFLQL